MLERLRVVVALGAFAWAAYLATIERQRRHQQVGAPAQSAA